MKVKILDWDSRFFNKQIGVIELGFETEIFADIERFDLLYVNQITDKSIVIDNFLLTYTETKVVFSKMVIKNNLEPNSFIFSAFEPGRNKEPIYNLAFESGKFSRFKLDYKFEQHEFEALYKTWVDNSLTKKFADSILFYREKNVILGFITYKINKDYATIGLLAVCPRHQGKGIGLKLLGTVENELNRKLIKELRIPTQLINKKACSFYAKLGYNIIEKKIIKHYWRV